MSLYIQKKGGSEILLITFNRLFKRFSKYNYYLQKITNKRRCKMVTNSKVDKNGSADNIYHVTWKGTYIFSKLVRAKSKEDAIVMMRELKELSPANVAVDTPLVKSIKATEVNSDISHITSSIRDYLENNCGDDQQENDYAMASLTKFVDHCLNSKRYR